MSARDKPEPTTSAATPATTPSPAAAAEKRPIDAYTHGDKKRTNNPPVGLVTPQNDPSDPPRKTYAFDPHLDPQLVWAGKAERTSLDVPSISLHVHERIDPKSIIAAVRSNGVGRPSQADTSADGAGKVGLGRPTHYKQRSLFEEPEENPRRRRGGGGGSPAIRRASPSRSPSNAC